MKKIREEVEIKGSGRVTDLVDDMIKQAYNITDEEYDYIAGETSDEDLQVFLDGLGDFKTPSTFTEKRRALEVRNKYIKMFNEKSEPVFQGNPNLCACHPDNGGDGTCQCD